jgi:transcriptional regulator with XRE-family HTH domain
MKSTDETVPIDLQKRIKNKLQKEKITLTSLARKLNMSSVALYNLLERHTMQVDRLWGICKVLHINLFQEIANHLECEAYNPIVEEKNREIENLQQKIMRLEKDIERLTTERDSFKEAISLLKL